MREGFEPYVTKAESHLNRINELMDFLGDKKYVSLDEKAKAQELMRNLKDGLEQDVNSVRKGLKSKRPSQQAEHFASAMLEAQTRLRAKSNSDPIRYDWYSDLYACQIDIEYFLSIARVE